ncbi:DUF924 family protein [Parerythrobacter jejuensis]|uniref:DUF924 family protein n=1 Tax=Parerythrobacter jejuensis TaxID=795812 RepID=A0A845ARS1_9SPHN|nr:DUF924 family protein [Parerythrobacter jejuensis]MXP31206.1 DUF924 family protein [Parerythrobacter jejuensis]MXP33966.1 DUF924 family protein [Parerythrobacter jejuensis]
MALASRRWAAEILHVWFHRLNERDWFGGSDHVDALLARRFAADWHSLRHRPAHEFLTDDSVALAAILLFDQVPRNLFRGEARAFTSDPLARAITHGALQRGWHRDLSSSRIQFLAMPLMHSEDIADQDLCCRIFANHVPGAFSFARSHRKMIARFGRFPHRNPVLGRPTTAAEQRAIDAGFAW